MAPSGESDARMRVSQNWGNAAHVYENDNRLTGNAAQNNQPRTISPEPSGQSHQGNAAQNHHYQGNAPQNYQGNAAQSYWGSAAQSYPGNAAREQMMNHPPGPSSLHGGSGFSLLLPEFTLLESMDTPSHNSTPGPSGADEDSITPFVSDSDTGDLLSSEDSEVSEDEEDATPPAKRPKLEKDTAVFLKGATEKPLEHEKREKLIARFLLPASDAAHPPKLDKDISALIPKSAFTYDRLLSRRSSSETWMLWAHSYMCSIV